jgi:hypothetical protein
MTKTLLDVEVPRTWPAALVGAVDEVIRRGLADPGASSLWVGDEGEGLVAHAASGAMVRLFHATRLLPHEVVAVRTHGLRLLDDSLVTEKLDAAVAAGVLAEAEAEYLSRHRAPLDGRSGRRAAQICAAATTRGFTDEPHAVWALLSHWGGEAIYWAHERTPSEARLRSIGTPAVVVFGAPIGRPADDWYPSLAALLLAARGGDARVNADVFLRSPVGAEDIEAIWLPGSAEYDRFPALPR